jgi:hypothetical protein
MDENDVDARVRGASDRRCLAYRLFCERRAVERDQQLLEHDASEVRVIRDWNVRIRPSCGRLSAT